MSRWTVVVGIICVLVVGCGGDDEDSSSGGGAASDGGTESLTIAARTVADAYAPVWWAEAKGYFDREGLDVTLQNGGQGTAASLVSERADLIGISLASVLGITNEGKPAKTVYATDSGSIAYVFAADPEIQSPADCTSMTTSIPGTNVYGWTVQMQEIFGVKWKLSQLTDVPSFAGTVVSGRTDCGTGSLSIYQTAVADGKLRVIFDPTKEEDHPPNWPDAGIENVWAGLETGLEEKRSAVEKFLRGYQAAVQDFLKTDSEEIATELLKNPDWKGFTVKALVPNIDAIKPSMSPYDGAIPEEAWQPSVEFFKNGGLSFLDPADDKWSYENNVDMSFYDAAIGSK